MNLSLYFLKNCLFSALLLCYWQTKKCFFIGFLWLWYVLTQKISLVHFTIVFSFILQCSWKQKLKAVTSFFHVVKSFLGSHLCKFLTSKSLQNFSSLWSICSNTLFRLITSSILIELLMKWLLDLPECSFSSLFYFSLCHPPCTVSATENSDLVL